MKFNDTTPEEVMSKELLANNIRISIVQSILTEYVKSEMCEHYCRYPIDWNEEKEGCELIESDICKNCPMNIL